MQQFCTYGSVRGASGQPASLPRQKLFSLPLADARGSVTPAESAPEWQEALFRSLLKLIAFR